MKRLSLGFSLSMAAAMQIVSATAHAQTPAPAQAPVAPVPPPQYPPPQFGAYPANPAVAPGPGPGTGPVVSLIADDSRARLQQQLLMRWQDVCLTPCGRPVDPAGLYRVGGGVIVPSEPFRLPRPDGQVVVQANTASKVKKWVGFGLGIGGVAAAALGGIYLAISLDVKSNDQNDAGFGSFFKDTTRTFGISYLVIGGILMLVGFPMFASNSSSSVQVR